MKYASIDTETLGLDPGSCDLIEMGVVLEDTADIRPVNDLPTFHCYVLPWNDDTYRGQPFAMSMHPTILRRIATKEPGYLYLKPEELAEKLAEFLSEHGYEYGQTPGKERLTCAGKNFANFDLGFLRQFPGWDDLIKVAHRTLDPGSMFADAHDSRVPDTRECLKRAKIDVDASRQHNAVYDARLVVSLLRTHWGMRV